ncbi:hypothetical protein M3027_04065 [Geoalkalibacter halelectricus]|nr:hypothetical protein [Geoalkalibacter halelectricus]MDO3377294.1 hypothetical protein [Geoalkalibacter halelectricus]
MQKHVDGQIRVRGIGTFGGAQPASGYGQVGLRGNQVNIVGPDLHAVTGAMNRHGGVARQKIVHHALEVGGEMLDDDERHAALGRHVIKKLLQRRQPAGRGAQADDEIGGWRALSWLGMLRGESSWEGSVMFSWLTGWEGI